MGEIRSKEEWEKEKEKQKKYVRGRQGKLSPESWDTRKRKRDSMYNWAKKKKISRIKRMQVEDNGKAYG